MYKLDLALNNLQWLICHKIKSNQGVQTALILLTLLPSVINDYCSW